MSVMDDVAALRSLAAFVPTAMVRGGQQTLLEMSAKLTGILGPNLGSNSDLLKSLHNAGIRLESAAVACQEFEHAINVVADRLANLDS